MWNFKKNYKVGCFIQADIGYPQTLPLVTDIVRQDRHKMKTTREII